MGKLLLKIKCIECGCEREITNAQTPVGECSLCKEDFGWLYAPKTMPNIVLRHGDLVVVNTRVPVDSPQRIFSVKRGNSFYYLQPKGEAA
jgi:hypothetical protein